MATPLDVLVNEIARAVSTGDAAVTLIATLKANQVDVTALGTAVADLNAATTRLEQAIAAAQ